MLIQVAPAMADNPAVSELYAKVSAQGDLVRKLKSEKASKDDVDAAVKVVNLI